MITLGELIPITEETKHQRDAIHIAIITAIAKTELAPGTVVSIDSAGAAFKDPKGVGIVDPYLDKPVQPTEMFWVLMNSKSVSNMRHNWDHPDIPSYHEEENAPDDWCIRDCN